MADERIVAQDTFEQSIKDILTELVNSTYSWEEYTDSEISDILEITDEQAMELEKIINDGIKANNKLWSSNKIDSELQNVVIEANKYTDDLVANLSNIKLDIVDSLPDSSTVDKSTIYILKDSSGGTNNILNVWSDSTSAFVEVGKLSVNMDNFYDKATVDAELAKKANADEVLKPDAIVSDLTTTSGTTTLSTAGLQTELDKKLNKTSILTAKDNSATDDQAYSAKAINTELDKKANNDDVVKKTDITTTIGSTSTDSQVPGAKAIYDMFLKNEKIMRYDLTYISSDSLNINLPKPGFYKISNPTKGVPDGNPKDYTLVNIPWMDNDILMKFGWQLLFTPRTTYFWVRRVWNYKPDYVYTEGDYSVFNKWQKVAATSVPDVPKTIVTTTVPSGVVVASSGLYIEYVVRNGWCNVNFMFNLTSSTKISWVKIADGLPKPALSNVNVILINEGGEIKRITTRIKTDGALYIAINDPISEENWWMGDVTYPVLES